MAELRNVVVTGMGVVSPFGRGCRKLEEGLQKGHSGIREITAFDTEGLPVRHAGEAPDIDPDSELKQTTPESRDRALKMAFLASAEALRQADLVDETDRQQAVPVGCLVGSGLGPIDEVQHGYGCFFQQGWNAVRPTTVPRSMFNSLSSQLSIHFGLTGMNHTVASACASGASAIGQAYHLIRHGYADAVLAGGVDSPLSKGIFCAWINLRVLARHEDPQRASRPFDRDRRGLVLSESAAMLVLEAEDHARQRGAAILGRIAGFGFSSDATHLTRPSLEGQVQAMEMCLRDGNLQPDEVDYVNAHGTATRANDETEAHAIVKVFGSRGSGLPISSTKSMMGHALGASSALEAVVCLQSIAKSVLFPTINCDDPEYAELGLDFVPHEARSHKINIALSNSFGFGGGNFVLALGGPP